MAHCGGWGYALQNVTIKFDDATNYSFLPHLTAITNVANAVMTNRPTAFQPVSPFP
jgi:hypothetical protein